MSAFDTIIRGTIRRRLLVNATVDPDEAAGWLPPGVTAHVGSDGVVVGCCLLEIENLRPAPLAASLGVKVMAAAHRISIDLPDPGGVGVYVPMRHTSSRMAAAVGGRVFPGVHRLATVTVGERGKSLDWTVVSANGESRRTDSEAEYALHVIVSEREASLGAATLDEVGDTCLGATVGLSPKRNGQLEASIMRIERMSVQKVEVRDLESSFISSFESARPATSYLMENVEVRWSSRLADAAGFTGKAQRSANGPRS